MAPLLELIDAHASDAQRRLQVLLVDADELHARQAGGWLEAGGDAQVLHCPRAADAGRLIRQRRWDLIVVDIDALDAGGLPQFGGRGTPVLATTRQLGLDTMRVALREQVDGLLPKPFGRAELLDQVAALTREPRERLRRQRRVVLAIGAHPDDVEIGCGGSLARHAANGDPIVVLTLSRGANGGDTQTRIEEARNAAELLHARLEIGDLPDSHIPEGGATIGLIERAVREVGPTHIYTHSPHDAHQDHRNAYLATVVAARQVPNLYCYQAPSSTTEFRPNLFVDIAGHIDAKVQAISAYRSQVARHAGLASEHIVATARYWGRYAGYGLAEPMEVIRQCER